MSVKGKKVFVLGGGISPFALERPDGSMADWATEAALAAAADAGVALKEVEASFFGVFSDVFAGQVSSGLALQDALGMCPKPAIRLEGGGASGGLALRAALAEIKAGFCDAALVCSADHTGRHLEGGPGLESISAGLDRDLMAPLTGGPLPFFALMMRGHMEKYGTTEEQMAWAAVQNHLYGRLNQQAAMAQELSVEEVLRSRVLAPPYKRFDLSLPADGAAAVILATESWAEAHAAAWTKKPRVEFSGSGCGSDFIRPGDRPQPYPGVVHFRSVNVAATQAYRMARLKHPKQDLDFFEVYDLLTGVELVTLEDLGLCWQGESGARMAAGDFRREGEVAVNLSGGLLSGGNAGGAVGVAQAVEVLRQLREEVEPERQARLKNGRGGMQTLGGLGSLAVVNIFERSA